MKTREPPPEKGRGKAEENAAAKPEMARFKSLAKKVMSVDNQAVRKEEQKTRRKRD